MSSLLQEYSSEIEMSLARIETLWCSEPGSETYGCMDREFWAYRTTRGFSSAPFQHVLSGLAHLSEMSEVGEAAKFRTMAMSMVDFWIKNRNKNGSSNEWFKNEQSFCATAMGLHAVGEALYLMKDSVPEDDFMVRCRQLQSSAHWLGLRDNELAANQRIASCTSRYVLGVLLHDQNICGEARDSLLDVQSDFSSHGYLSEYGGIDIGYSLLSLDLLVAAHRAGLSESEQLANDVCRQLIMVMSGSGYLPFELGSRSTFHKFFGGVSYFGRFLETARSVASTAADARTREQADSLSNYDDRYFSTFAFSAFMRRLFVQQSQRVSEPLRSPRQDHLPPPPIVSRPCPPGRLFEHRKFGHALSYVLENERKFTHLGYFFEDSRGHRWTSLTEQQLSREGYQFTHVSDSAPLVKFEFLVRLVFSACRLPFVASFVSQWARTRAGRPRDTIPMVMHRSIAWLNGKLVVEDRFKIRGTLEGRLSIADHFPYHSPSHMKMVLANLDASKFVRNVKSRDGESEIVIRWCVWSTPQLAIRVDVE